MAQNDYSALFNPFEVYIYLAPLGSQLHHYNEDNNPHYEKTDIVFHFIIFVIWIRRNIIIRKFDQVSNISWL